MKQETGETPHARYHSGNDKEQIRFMITHYQSNVNEKPSGASLEQRDAYVQNVLRFFSYQVQGSYDKDIHAYIPLAEKELHEPVYQSIAPYVRMMEALLPTQLRQISTETHRIFFDTYADVKGKNKDAFWVGIQTPHQFALSILTNRLDCMLPTWNDYSDVRRFTILEKQKGEVFGHMDVSRTHFPIFTERDDESVLLFFQRPAYIRFMTEKDCVLHETFLKNNPHDTKEVLRMHIEDQLDSLRRYTKKPIALLEELSRTN